MRSSIAFLTRPRSPLAMLALSIAVIALGTGALQALGATGAGQATTASYPHDLNAGQVNHLIRVALAKRGLLNGAVGSGATGSTGPAGAPGAKGSTGPTGPAGISGQTRWGNVLVPASSNTVLATIGPFTLTGVCDAGGNASETLTSTTTAQAYGEDGSPVAMTANQTVTVTDDEDYDEAFYAWSPSTGVSINGVPLHWNRGHGDPNNCEFQGELWQTS